MGWRNSKASRRQTAGFDARARANAAPTRPGSAPKKSKEPKKGAIFTVLFLGAKTWARGLASARQGAAATRVASQVTNVFNEKGVKNDGFGGFWRTRPERGSETGAGKRWRGKCLGFLGIFVRAGLSLAFVRPDRRRLGAPIVFGHRRDAGGHREKPGPLRAIGGLPEIGRPRPG